MKKLLEENKTLMQIVNDAEHPLARTVSPIYKPNCLRKMLSYAIISYLTNF